MSELLNFHEVLFKINVLYSANALSMRLESVNLKSTTKSNVYSKYELFINYFFLVND